MPILEHWVSVILDVNQPWVDVMVEVEHHFDQPNLAGPNLRKGAFPRPKVDIVAFTYVPER